MSLGKITGKLLVTVLRPFQRTDFSYSGVQRFIKALPIFPFRASNGLVCVIIHEGRPKDTTLQFAKYVYGLGVYSMPDMLNIGCILAGDDLPSSNTLSDSVERWERRRRRRSQPLQWQMMHSGMLVAERSI